MSQVKYIRTLRISDIAHLIRTVGDKVTVVVRGEPGTGKSSILALLKKMMGASYHYVYVDVPNVGDGDLVMRVPDRDTKAIEQYISALVAEAIATGKPVVIMLDEYLKASKFMKPLFTRLILERYWGDVALPPGSIVFATSNLASDGVGDTTQAHEGNRVMYVEMAKPTHLEWVLWAQNNGVSSVTRTLVQMKSQLMDSYRTLSADRLNENPFIFNPTKPEQSVTFCSPRSLAKADVVVSKRAELSPEIVSIALEGVVGRATADLFHTFLMMEKDLTPIADIIANPEAAAIPATAGATILTMMNAVDELETQDDICKFLRFCERINNREYRDVFMSLVCESERLAPKAMQNKQISEWYVQNHKIIPTGNTK